MNCKPGIMAMIIGSPNLAANGMIVDVVERCRDVSGLPAWLVKISDAFDVTSKLTGARVSNLVYCPDAWLRPISGEPVTDDVTDEVPA